MKKIVLSIVLLFSLLFPMKTIYAEEPSLKDCFEENGECEELKNETNIKVNESNDMLLENDEKTTTSFFFNFVKMIFALLLILALMYLILVFLKRKNRLQSQNETLQNLGGLNVGANKSIQLIKIGEKVYMVGVGDDVQLLEEITDDVTISHLEKQAAEKMEPTHLLQTFFPTKKQHVDKKVESSFKDELKQWSKKRQQLLKKKVKDDSNE